MTQSRKLSLFLENNQHFGNQDAAYIYEDPLEIISITKPEYLNDGFEEIKAWIQKGYHVAGWFSYEAGLCLEDKLESLIPENLKYPLIHMGVYQTRKVISATDADNYWRGFENPSAYQLEKLTLSQSREEYQKAFNAISDYLKAGDIYQVNYTQKANFDFKGSPKAFYAALRNAQQVEYAAYIESDDFSVLSLSPELFIKRDGDKLTAKPMKGTCKRGRTIDQDAARSTALYNSDKERAENLMIVDLLRNDLSKLASKGSIRVEKLFEVEKYNTLFTMTSTIEGRIDDVHSSLDVMTSIYPCGSVTGAPKIRAQQIISELEKRERGIYTGAIGYFTPDGDMCFSVPIRTITLERDGLGEIGIGSAIVADSVAEQEYDECLLKAEFALKNYPKFDLIESMCWRTDDGIALLEEHMKRLQSSAEYFSFLIDADDIRKEINQHISFLKCEEYEFFKVRVLLSKRGDVTISSEKIIEKTSAELPSITISDKTIDSQDRFYFHKTTRRNLFSQELNKHKKETGCLDVIFTNERGELTEGSYTNLFIKKDGVFYTPPLDSGLLAGIYRQKILDDDSMTSEEKILFVSDLESADEIYLSNAVRGLMRVKI